MRLLAFETSTELCSLAIEIDGERVGQDHIGLHIHSEVLLPQAMALLTEAGLNFGQLDGLVVGTGPGGFTSLRLGLSVVQGLSLAHRLPIYPVSSLLNVAMAYTGFDEVWVLMDAKMGEVYAQRFRSVDNVCLQPIDEPNVLPPSDIHFQAQTVGQVAVVGNALKAYESLGDLVATARAHHDGDVMPSALRALALRDKPVEPWALRPEYVRDQVTN